VLIKDMQVLMEEGKEQKGIQESNEERKMMDKISYQQR
jgi:hypothetical protein